MNNKPSIEEQYQQLRTLIDLSETVVKQSNLITDDLERDYLAGYQTNQAEAKQFRDQGSRSALKQLQNEVLTPWNETYDEDSQHFWRLVKQKDVPVEQTDYLEKILKRGRIANFTEYNIVQDSLVVWQQEGQITEAQADQLEEMLANYEQKIAT